MVAIMVAVLVLGGYHGGYHGGSGSRDRGCRCSSNGSDSIDGRGTVLQHIPCL